jgi:hypothetical protein
MSTTPQHEREEGLFILFRFVIQRKKDVFAMVFSEWDSHSLWIIFRNFTPTWLYLHEELSLQY